MKQLDMFRQNALPQPQGVEQHVPLGARPLPGGEALEAVLVTRDPRRAFHAHVATCRRCGRRAADPNTYCAMGAELLRLAHVAAGTAPPFSEPKGAPR